MPRKKLPPKFKYTIRRNGVLYVKYPVAGVKYPVWRKCEEETQKAVDEIIEEIKADRAAALTASITPTNCKLFFGYYLERIKSRISTRTYDSRKTALRLYLTPVLGHLDLAQVEKENLSDLYENLLISGYSTETIKKAHTVASSVFKEAVSLKLIASNPAADLRSPKQKGEPPVRAMSEAEVRRFLETCKGSPHRTVFELALETGMRPQEYLALRWTDIDFKRQTVQIVRALVQKSSGGGYYFKDPKTRHSRRMIPLSKQICEKLLVHQKKQHEYLEQISDRIRRSCKPSREYRREFNKKLLENHRHLNLVFPSQDFTPLRDINLNKRYFKAIIKAAGLPETFSLYCLRHSCATLLLLANVNPKIVSERLGHSGVAITLQTYSHVLPGMQSEATAALATFLYPELSED